MQKKKHFEFKMKLFSNFIRYYYLQRYEYKVLKHVSVNAKNKEKLPRNMKNDISNFLVNKSTKREKNLNLAIEKGKIIDI